MNDGRAPSPADGKKPSPKSSETATVAVDRVLQDTVKDILSPAQQKQVLERLSPKIESLVVSVAKFHSGPLPSVEVVQGYEVIAPGSFDRIVTMAEKDQDAVIASQAYAARAESQYRYVCLGSGLLALAAILVAIVYLAMHEHANVAIAIAGLGAAGIVSAFINARWTPKDEKKNQAPPRR